MVLAILGLAGLLIALAAALAAARRWAVRVNANVHDADATLAKFRELHERGGLSDAEYRNIKAKLAPSLSLAVTAAERVRSQEELESRRET
jgi:uncharacterized membrane protein